MKHYDYQPPPRPEEPETKRPGGFKARHWVYLVFFVFAFDWVALHDILQGEPNPIPEVMVLLFSLVIYVTLILAVVYRKPGQPFMNDLKKGIIFLSVVGIVGVAATAATINYQKNLSIEAESAAEISETQ